MKKLSILSVLAFALCACTPKYTVTVANPSDFSRMEELVEIPVSQFPELKPADWQWYVVKRGDKIIPSQVTYDGLLLFQSGLGAGETAGFTVTLGDAGQKYEPKTYGRFVPERKDDFVWENDRVAFRIYGPALVAADGPSNGIDIWYKRTSDLIADKWYADDIAGKQSYHDDHGEGLDDYKVGRTLGAGGMAPYIDGRLVLNRNFETQELLDNGPVRTSFKLTYPDLEIAPGVFVKETRTISIDAGSQLSRVMQEYGVTRPIKVAAGFPLHDLGAADNYASGPDWLLLNEPPTGKTSGVSLGLVIPQGIEDIEFRPDQLKTADKTHYPRIMAVTTYEPGKPVTYYTGYGWSEWWKQPEADFAEYLKNFAEALKQPFVITVK